MSTGRTKYYSLTEVSIASGSAISLSEGSTVSLPADHQILMACDVKEILSEIKKMNIYLAYIVGEEICQ